MMQHTHTECSEINFSKLEERIMQINDPKLGQFQAVKKMLHELAIEKGPTLIMATGGSKVIAHYLQLIMEALGIICEVIEPRDYVYKMGKATFSNLIVISASGNTNGIESALTNFEGKKYLICEHERGANYKVISWGNRLYDKEKSFISLATSLGPITILLHCIISLDLSLDYEKIKMTNRKIRELLARSVEKINNLSFDFKDTTLIQIMSGYETRPSCSVLESNLVEIGLLAPVVHDKGSYCHGRSNLLFRYPNSHVIYLTHGVKELDQLLIDSINGEYSNVSLFSDDDLEEDGFWKEYYLMLQMYFLSKKIADDKGIDATQPDYNPRLVKKLYHYRGGM